MHDQVESRDWLLGCLRLAALESIMARTCISLGGTRGDSFIPLRPVAFASRLDRHEHEIASSHAFPFMPFPSQAADFAALGYLGARARRPSRLISHEGSISSITHKRLSARRR